MNKKDVSDDYEKINKKFIKIGEINVDSASIIMADPLNVYCEKDENSAWSLTRDKLNKVVFGTIFDGVVIESGNGDGIYPVYARFENSKLGGKRIAEIRIILDLDKKNWEE